MKKILISVVLALVLVIAIAGSALADSPTTVTVDWNGGGIVGSTVTAGNDAVATFTSAASLASGSFAVTDYNDNPYSYSVDTVNSNIVASVTGGSVSYQVNHTDQAPMYGAAGQAIYGYVYSNDGNAQMALWSNSNYAAMGIANYGHSWTTTGDTFYATGASIDIINWVRDSSGEFAQLVVDGSGTAKVDAMSSDVGANSLTFGSGAGCYTDASFDGTGDQLVTFTTVGNNGVSQFGTTTTGVTTLTTVVDFVGTASIPDFHAIVN